MTNSKKIQKSLSGFINWVGISVFLSGNKSSIRQKYSRGEKIPPDYYPALLELVELLNKWREKWAK